MWTIFCRLQSSHEVMGGHLGWFGVSLVMARTVKVSMLNWKI